MEIDSTQQKAELLQSLLTGPLSSSISKLSGSSRAIPSSEDFHFYYNFPQFQTPIKQISQTSQSLLQTIGNSTSLSKPLTFPDDPDESYNWLVDVNDQLFEKFDSSVDEFQRVRKGQEDDDGGFQLVQGKKKKAVEKELAKVSKASGGQTKVPFHIPSIRRPQDEYKIVVDNGSEAFVHVWLEKSEDGSRFIHPLEKFSELDFVDKNIGDLEPVRPPPFEATPFKIVENIEDLKKLAAKLQVVNEIAVDLEHNQYRSFQGLTCLMQISTRTEDFVVDTLKLRAHIGPYLREIFKDPSKRKVMHGADRDILWLQRDFSIYVCNLFDTGQASRILQLERNSLEYLLHHFCGVTANKIYQTADWRLRPIPSEMLKYAREDTHYLLHIYDLMRVRLLTTTNNENGEALLLEVYKRSYDICMQLYEKEILTDTSYFHIYGLHGADFNSQQVAVVAGLCEWRDAVARAEDESTGFILPNRALLEIARLMPVTAGKLRQLVKFKHPYVERNLGSVVSIIKRSIENASAYESAAELIKKEHAEKVAARNMVVADESEVLPAGHTQPESLDNEDGTRISEQTAEHVSTSMQVKEEQVEVSPAECGESGQLTSFDGDHMEHAKESLAVSSHTGSTDMKTDTLPSTTVSEATVQVLKKPSRAFGAMLGKGSKKKLVLDQKAEIKVEQIKASVTLQFHSFPEGNEQQEPHVDERTKCLGIAHPKGPVSPAAEISKLEDIISLENDSDYESPDDVPTAVNDSLEQRENGSSIPLASSDTGDKPMSLFELSSSFQSLNANRSTRRVEKSQETDILQLKPFDYEAARTEMEPGEQEEDGEIKDDDGMKGLQHSKERRRKMSTRGPGDEGTKDFPSVRRRQAFPHTGNRSFTFH